MKRYPQPKTILTHLICFFPLFLIITQVSAQPTILEESHNNRMIIVGIKNLTQLPHQTNWADYFTVYVGEHVAQITGQPSVLGAFHITRDTLIFTPRFGFMKGQTYTAQFHTKKFNTDFYLNTNTQTVSHRFTVPVSQIIPTTIVSQIYPSSNTLPENLLKFYIHFSAPMQRDLIYTHIQLLDESGQAIDQAFLEVTPELWSPTTERFTLFFDPGRIKRGLLPHQHLGMALKEGHTFRLVISQNLKDANGNPLTETHTKSFSVTSADRTSPNTKKWRVTPPTRNTHAPLHLEFDESLDHALLNNMITVKAPNTKLLLGNIEITHSETQWHFTPEVAWSSGRHTIHINPLLEDVAGNQLTRLFDVDMEKSTQTNVDASMITLPFLIP